MPWHSLGTYSQSPLCGISILRTEPPSGSTASITMLSIDTKMLAKKAVQKLDTLKPLTRPDTIMIINALMTNRNNPKVTKVSGRVNTISSGFTTAFARPSSSADTTRDEVSANLTPLKM